MVMLGHVTDNGDELFDNVITRSTINTPQSDVECPDVTIDISPLFDGALNNTGCPKSFASSGKCEKSSVTSSKDGNKPDRYLDLLNLGHLSMSRDRLIELQQSDHKLSRLE